MNNSIRIDKEDNNPKVSKKINKLVNDYDNLNHLMNRDSY